MSILSVKYSASPMHTGHHFHDCHQLLYILQGEVTVTINGEEHIASGGTLFVLSRFDRHAIRVTSDEYKRYTLRISADTPPTFAEDVALSAVLVNHGVGFRHMIELGDYRAPFEAILSQMAREYESQDPLYQPMLENHFQALLILLYRRAPALFPTEHSRSTLIIGQIRQRLETDFREIITLEELSEEYHISPSHLSHLFKRITGYAPMEYLQECRMSAAKKLLGTSDLPIKEIVFRCGFGDESNFSRTFKRYMSMTPSEFRQREKRH